MKENWMKWDIASENDLKTRWYLSQFKDKARGLGFFIHVVSLLYQSSLNWIEQDDMFLQTTADYLGWTTEEVGQALAYLVQAKLFIAENGKFASIRVLREAELRRSISKKKSESGKKGGMISATSKHVLSTSKHVLTEVKQTQADQIRLDKIRSDQILEDGGAHAQKNIKTSESSNEIRNAILNSLGATESLETEEMDDDTQSPSLVLKNGTALAVGDYFSDMTEIVATNRMFVSLGRRPLKKYPQIWITPQELKSVLDTAFDKKVGPREIFAQVSNFVTDQLQKGNQLHRIKAVPALTGWALQEALNIQTAEIRRDNQKNFKTGKPDQKENNPYKNFKVYK